jgi:dTDP-4-amino-4,6-dideoxygalactose transaminase
MRIGRTLPPAAAPIGFADILSGIRGIFRGQRELERFRSELKQYFGVKHCFLVSSGRAAFTLTLLALKELFPLRDEVIIPAFTCYSVPSSIVRAGLKIRLCDLDVGSLDFDFTQLVFMLSEANRPRRADAYVAASTANFPGEASGADNDSRDPNKKLLAIVPTHLFGFPSDVPRLRELIQDPGVTIVEDAAQAMGETAGGRKLGTLGDVNFFSLGRGKALSTVEGGVILTNRDDIADVLKRRVDNLADYGLWRLTTLSVKAAGLMLFTHPSLFWIPRAMPFLRLGETLFDIHFPILRMSSFQAGLSANWRERLQKIRDVRKANVRRWMGVLEDIGDRGSWLQRSQSLGLLRCPIRIQDPDHRKFLLEESADKGAGVSPVYPESINRLSELEGQILMEAFPVAENCTRELVTLPTHEYLAQEDVIVIRRLLSDALTMRGYRSP